jgi:hypothetical protein
VANIFSDVVKGFGWLGKRVAGVPSAVNRVIAITKDVEAEALTTAMVKDSGTAFTALRALSAVVVAAYAAKGLDFAEDLLVVAALKAFGTAVMAHGTWLDVIDAEGKTATDFDKLGASAAAALKKLEADV